jgi:hypothetical protein
VKSFTIGIIRQTGPIIKMIKIKEYEVDRACSAHRVNKINTIFLEDLKEGDHTTS